MNRGTVKISRALRVVGRVIAKIAYFIGMAVLHVLDFIFFIIESLFAPIFWDW